MARIFLSYAHEDQAAARRIVDALAREGLEAWWDHEIPPGRSWDEMIGARIAEAEVVLVIWSARSIGSNFVKEEAQLAQDKGKLLPVRVDDVEPPIGFRRVHAANLIGWRGEAEQRQWQALVREVRMRLGAPAAASGAAPLSTPADATRSTNLLVGAAAIAVALAAIALFTRQPNETGATDAPAEIQTQTAQQKTPSEPAPSQPIALENTAWSGVLTIGMSQHPIEFRFHDDGIALLVNQTGFPQEWVWRYVGDGVEITGHAQIFRGAVDGDVFSGTYEGERGSGAMLLIRQ